MRIALVNETMAWGGGERFFLDAGVALAGRGHDVTLVAAEGGELSSRAAEAGLPYTPLKDLAPDVCLLNSRRDLAAVLAAHAGRPPFPLGLRRGIDRPLHDGFFRRRQWKALAAILANSEATAATVRRSLPWFPTERIRRILNPVAFAPEPPVLGDGPAIRIGAAGRLVRQKGYDVLLRALALLPDLDLTTEIAGDGKLRARLARLAGRLGLATRVTFLGHLDDLAPFYARQDLIAVPSRYEGFGYVPVEAALAGLPVVASDVSSLREVVLHGETGQLVPPGSAEALAEAIRGLAADPVRRADLGSRARESALRRFAPTAIYDELDRFLTFAAGLGPVGEMR